MSKQICQSCSMPLKKESDYGTEANASKSQKYCALCFKNGQYIEPTISVREMQKKIIGVMWRKMKIPPLFGKFMVGGIPKLERWREQV
jgi:hypothetical protein